MNDTGFAAINGAQLYFEATGDGRPFIMIHAGVADSRQWDHEFAHFGEAWQAIRYDLRGYGKSKPVTGEFRHLDDLTSLLEHLDVTQPAVLMGCSMGGGLALDFTLAHPDRVAALILVDSGPSGLRLDIPLPGKFQEVEAAFDAGDLDRACELEVQIWFDGLDRTPAQVNRQMRKLAFDMNRIAVENESAAIAKRLPDAATPAAGRLDELALPVLVCVGASDIPYMIAAADYMVEHIPDARKALIEDAAHLPNMDHPRQFREIVDTFLNDKHLAS